MVDFPVEDLQFWGVTLLAVVAVGGLLIRLRKGTHEDEPGGRCSGC